MDSSVNTLPKMLIDIANQHPNTPAQYYREKGASFTPVYFKDLVTIVKNVAGGLLSLGIKRGEYIGLFSDNRKEWLQIDMGLLAIGAIDVPRGCDATEHDLKYILSSTECKTVIAENSTQIVKILSLKDFLPNLQTIILLDELKDNAKEMLEKCNVNCLTFLELVEKGKDFNSQNPLVVNQEIEKGTEEDLACIIFTSGTTGEPKGVMLSHKNFLTQLDELPERIHLEPGSKAICVLPVWHAFQRSCEYAIIIQSSAICYSKPVGSILLNDMQALNPVIMPAVPRVFEAVYDGIMRTMRKTGGIVYSLFRFFITVAIFQNRLNRKMFRATARFKKDNIVLIWIVCFIPWLILTLLKAIGSKVVFSKIKSKLGTSFECGVSGGGALPPAIDEFFSAVGIKISEGYGLTETAPVVCARHKDHPIFGTVGSPLRGVEVKIVDENDNILPPGKKGLVKVRGGIVMKGYFNKPELTAATIDKDGWFNTGDIGMLTIDGELSLRGRMKDTIVLRGGENVEPLPIEMKISESRYIATAVVVGQDQRSLGALIIPAKEEILVYARENYIPNTGSYAELLQRPEIRKLLETEISSLVSSKNGFKMFERICNFVILENPFTVGVELSAKQEIMRYKITEIYEKQIFDMYKE